jgi:hypothetical protein
MVTIYLFIPFKKWAAAVDFTPQLRIPQKRV